MTVLTISPAAPIYLTFLLGLTVSTTTEIPTAASSQPEIALTTETDAVCRYTEYSRVCECDHRETAATTANDCGFSRNFTCNGEVMYIENVYNLTRAECIVQAEWSEWASWSACNDTCSSGCGGGWRNRLRTCDTPPTVQPWQIVISCNGSDIDESLTQAELCACGGTWSSWSECDHTCDGGKRVKFCSECATSLIGLSDHCESSAESYQLCNANLCQVDPLEEGSGVYVVLKTSLELEQYVEVRDHMRKAVGRSIIGFCNSSVANYVICCPDRSPSSFQRQSRTTLDSVVLKRAAPRDNDSLSMTVFIVLTYAASGELCVGGNATLDQHAAVVKRSATMYLPPTLLVHLLESGLLASTIIDSIRSSSQNVSVSFVTSSFETTATSAVKAAQVTPTEKPCKMLMEFSAADEQCIYGANFYVAVMSPSALMLIVVVVVFSACKLERRHIRSAKNHRLKALERRATQPGNRRDRDLETHSRPYEAASSALKAESLQENAANHYANSSNCHETAESHYADMTASCESLDYVRPSIQSLSPASRDTYVDLDNSTEPTQSANSLSLVQQPSHQPLPHEMIISGLGTDYESEDYVNVDFSQRDDTAAGEDEDFYESVT